MANVDANCRASASAEGQSHCQSTANALRTPSDLPQEPVADRHAPQTNPDPEELCVVCRGRPPAQRTPANRGFSGALGHAIGAAAARALERERQSSHKLEVRFSITHDCCRQELTIMAGLAEADWANQTKTAVRQIALEDLDDRADELPGLVDEAVSEIEAHLELDG